MIHFYYLQIPASEPL